jgi:hypothetical protein
VYRLWHRQALAELSRWRVRKERTESWSLLLIEDNTTPHRIKSELQNLPECSSPSAMREICERPEKSGLR